MNNQNNIQHDEAPMEVIREMLSEMKEEKAKYLDLLRNNEEMIADVNQIIKEIEINTDCDLSIFSPRSHDEEMIKKLDYAKEKRDQLYQENELLTVQMNRSTKRIKSIEDIKTFIEEKEKKHSETEEKNQKQKSGNGLNLLDQEQKNLILDIQEKERQRIARDLHDTSLQSLIHLIHKLEICSKYMDTDIIQAKLEIATCNKLLRQLIQEGRDQIFNLRPMSFDDFGFVEVMERLKMNLVTNSSMDIQFDIDPIDTKQTLVLITIYRIIQEAANNAIKHSNGSVLRVTGKMTDELYEITIVDNGIGISKDKTKHSNHFGLAMIEEQVQLLSGLISYHSELGKGTEIEIIIPIN